MAEIKPMSVPSTLVLFALILATRQSAAAPPKPWMQSAADYSRAHGGQTMVVLFDGNRVFEQYDNGGAADKLQGLVSGSKSFVGVAAVAAVQDGHIRLDDPASDGIRQWRADPAKSKITYRQLLNMTSGLTPTGRAPWPAWKEMAAKPMAFEPGSRFVYGAFHLNTFAYALETKLGRESFEEFVKRRVLDPIGVKLEWQLRCEDGHPQVGGGAVMTARDWATFGEFVRQRGKWKGHSVIDEKLLAECFRGSDRNPAYGLAWWLKAPIDAKLEANIPFPEDAWEELAKSVWLPNDLVAAYGGGKQWLFVIPSSRLVVVRQGSNSQGFSDIEFLSWLICGKSATK